PVTAMLAGVVHQPLDFALGEIASFNCQVYDVWNALLGSRFHRGKTFLFDIEWLAYTPLLNSQSPMEKLPAPPPEDRPRDRTEGAKAACDGRRYLEGGQVAWDPDWHGAAHRKRESQHCHFAFVAELFMCGPPVGGDFLVSNFHPGAIPGNLVRND